MFSLEELMLICCLTSEEKQRKGHLSFLAVPNVSETETELHGDSGILKSATQRRSCSSDDFHLAVQTRC